MKPNRVPDDLIEAGFDAIRAWYAAHPGSNSYLDDRTQMRIVLAAALSLHEQQLRAERDQARAELETLRAELHDEWGVQCHIGTDDYGTNEAWARRDAHHGTLKARLVGQWREVEEGGDDV